MSQGGRYLGGEERMAWACLALMLAILGWSAGRVVPREAAPPAAGQGACR